MSVLLNHDLVMCLPAVQKFGKISLLPKKMHLHLQANINVILASCEKILILMPNQQTHTHTHGIRHFPNLKSYNNKHNMNTMRSLHLLRPKRFRHSIPKFPTFVTNVVIQTAWFKDKTKLLGTTMELLKHSDRVSGWDQQRCCGKNLDRDDQVTGSREQNSVSLSLTDTQACDARIHTHMLGLLSPQHSNEKVLTR